MEAPQSGDDVRLVVEDLQALDSLLDVRWEPHAVIVKRGGYDAMGKIINPTFRGLWEIIRYDGFATQSHRPWTRICFVTQPVEIVPGVKAMVEDGEYAPLGAWLVEFMRAADKWNREEAQKLSATLDAMNERNDQAAIDAGDEATAEAAGYQYFEGTKAGGGVSEFHPVKVNLT